jgi:hypothetical protein
MAHEQKPKGSHTDEFRDVLGDVDLRRWSLDSCDC